VIAILVSGRIDRGCPATSLRGGRHRRYADWRPEEATSGGSGHHQGHEASWCLGWTTESGWDGGQRTMFIRRCRRVLFV